MHAEQRHAARALADVRLREAAALVAMDGEAGRVDVRVGSCVLLDEGPEGVDVAGLGGLRPDGDADHVAGRRGGCG